MTGSLVSLRRISALSVAITLLAAPIASAQTPAPASTSDAPANTVLLSPTAFARLVQPSQTDVAPAPDVADSPRPSLLHNAVTGREAPKLTPAPPPRRMSKQNKWATIVLVGIVGGLFLAACLSGCGE